MAEYYLIGKGRGGESEHYLGTTPNIDGEFPLRESIYGAMRQTFTETPEGLVLKVSAVATILNNPIEILIDKKGNGSGRITTAHTLKVEKARDIPPTRDM